MIIKDGDFYGALAHLKEAKIAITDEPLFSGFIFDQIEAAEIALKSCITDLLDENGEIKTKQK